MNENIWKYLANIWNVPVNRVKLKTFISKILKTQKRMMAQMQANDLMLMVKLFNNFYYLQN